MEIEDAAVPHPTVFYIYGFLTEGPLGNVDSLSPSLTAQARPGLSSVVQFETGGEGGRRNPLDTTSVSLRNTNTTFVFILLFLFRKNKTRLMKTQFCLCVCVFPPYQIFNA
jgi:hypothetical protein